MGGTMEDAGQGSGDLFGFFVMQHQMAAMIYMGKVVNPATRKIERNLEGARFSIDLLGMLEEKTRGNLTPDEAKLLEQTLTNLRLNYIDEARRDKEGAANAREKETESDANGDNPEKMVDGDEGEEASDAGPR